MSFYNRIKNALTESRWRHREQMPVRVNDLKELLHHYERLEELHRANSLYDHNWTTLEQKLDAILRALYISRKRAADEVMLVVMQTLRPIVEERLKQFEIEYKG